MVSLKTRFLLQARNGTFPSEEVERYKDLFLEDEKERLESQFRENHPFLALILRVSSLFGYESNKTKPVEWETSPFMAYRSEYRRCKKEDGRDHLSDSEGVRFEVESHPSSQIRFLKKICLSLNGAERHQYIDSWKCE